jgi:hypothetical protein
MSIYNQAIWEEFEVALEIKKSAVTFAVIFYCLAIIVIPILGIRFQPLSTRNRIYITDSGQFKRWYGLPGKGTSYDPYRIENIDADMEITIKYVSSYFVINNCDVSKIELVRCWSRFYIENTKADSIRILNSHRYYYYQPSDYNNFEIKNSSCATLNVLDSTNFLIENNHIDSISLVYCYYSTVTNNQLLNNIGREDGLYLDECEKIEIISNQIKNYTVGVTIGSCHEIDFFDNTIEHCYLQGCFMHGTTASEFTNNRFNFNAIGLEITDNCFDLVIAYNEFLNNSEYAIVDHKTGSYILIYYNNFIDNNPDGTHYVGYGDYDPTFDGFSQAYSSHNFGYSAFGNFWSEWNNPDTAYPLDNYYVSIFSDPYPLRKPIIF